MHNKKLIRLAKEIRELKAELFEAVSGEVCNNLSNEAGRDLLFLDRMRERIFLLEKDYVSLGGIFSDCYIPVDGEFFSKKSVSLAAILSLSDSGKIAMDKKGCGDVWLIIPSDKNKDASIEKIKNIVGDSVRIIKKSIPMHDMIIKNNLGNDLEM